MTNALFPLPRDPILERTGVDLSRFLVSENPVPVVLLVGGAYLAFFGWFEEAEQKAQTNQLRG